jgi:hypothetical protein
MLDPLQRESLVLEAVRALLEAGTSGGDVSAAMASMVAATSSLHLCNLDDWERKLRAELLQVERRSDSPRWKFWSRRERFASWLDLCSANGFRRERILRSASNGAPSSFIFALALRRLNDWVPEVRAAARERLPVWAERSAPEDVVDALWYTFTYWGSWGRLEDADRALLVALTSIEKVACALEARIQHASAGPAAHVLSQAGRGPALDSWLPELAHAAVQPSVRAKAYRCLLEGRVVWTVGRRWIWTQIQWCKGRFEYVLAERPLPKCERLLDLLGRAMDDRSPLVRRVAAEFFITHLGLVGDDAPAIALRFASDSNPTVAERGRYALTQLEGQP